MLILKKSMPRRSFLRGAGTAIALPFLDAMIPALAAVKDRARAVPRFSIVYTPNGMNMDHWTPQGEGRNFELSRTLEPLAPYRDRMLVLSGMHNNSGDPLPGEGESAQHERAGGVFLTSAHPYPEGRTGVSIDQVVAGELGKQTQLASLELGLHSTDLMGNCEKGWSCAYKSTLSWRTPTTPLPVENRPRAVFERLFGGSSNTDPEARIARIRKEKSILDDITAETASMMRSVGSEDRARLTQYLDGMREVERRIQMAERQSGRELPSMERPAGVPAAFVDHLKLMFDLQVLAYQTDLTRMITFMTGPVQSNRTYPDIGIPDVHHSLSHHQGKAEKLDKVARIDRYHSQLLTYYLDKLDATPDVDGSLLDNMIIMYGSALSDGNAHLLQDLPILLFGGGAGRIKGGLYHRYPDNTPIANLYLTVLDMLEIRMQSFGDSTGRVNLS